MQKIRIENDQHNSNPFTIVYVNGGSVELVEIHAIDMDGWMLYECFILPSYQVHYFSWDEDAEAPEWINLENEEPDQEITILCTELMKYKQPAA